MDIETLRNTVFTEKKNYGALAKGEWGSKTLLDYYTQDFPNLTTPSSTVLNVIRDETSMILGNTVAEAAYDSVERRRWVNTTDHHGLLMHPYFYGGNLAQSHPRTRHGDALVVLPFGTVSLGNDSYPRGFFFHDAEGKEARFFFKSLKYRRMPVCSLAPCSKEEFTRESSRIMTTALATRARERLHMFLEVVRDDSRVWEQETYSEQLTVLNSIFWKLLFDETRGELVYLDIETVVRSLLREHLLKESVINRLLTDTAWQRAYVAEFEGVTGAHHGTHGTHLFWYIDRERNERVQLFVKGASLSSSSGEVEFACEPSVLLEALTCRILVPSTALMMIVLAEEGLSCAGGSSQGDYLDDILTKWATLVTRFGGSAPTRTHTTILGGDYAYFSVARGEKESLASLFDVFLHLDDPGAVVDRALETVTMSGAIDAILPHVHHYMTGRNCGSVSVCAPARIPLTTHVPFAQSASS